MGRPNTAVRRRVGTSAGEHDLVIHVHPVPFVDAAFTLVSPPSAVPINDAVLMHAIVAVVHRMNLSRRTMVRLITNLAALCER